ncbi:MAG: HlyD family type I secretion periplasmic adaptor subunit [Leptolyngbyaceae cyanobacterium SL_7_1]|nr:HlyD family type I secretion periplasmic adaptor subunit [Leptolyngbyaceae cyanobacterium SL_7_1]
MQNPSTSPAQARQTRQQFANPEDYLSYELGKAVRELPPLYTRLLAASLTGLVFGSIAWAYFSFTDEVAVTQGEIIPSQQVRPVTALQGGIISKILVEEGDEVKQGDVLLEQDPGVSNAEVDRLRDASRLIRQDIARLEAESEGRTTTGVAQQDQLLSARLQDFDDRRAAAGAEANRQQAAIAEAEARLTRLEENLANAQITLANAQERENSLRPLVEGDNGAIPRFDYLDARDRVTQAQDQVASLTQEIAAQQQAIRQAEQSYEAAEETANSLGSQRRSEILTQLNQRREELANVNGQLETASRQQDRETVRAPIDGTIYNVQATLGEGTVEPGEELLSILPQGQNLVLEVKVLNRDIGFVNVGDRAKIKLATFPYQEFGTINGEVTQISPNATVDRDLGPVFTATVEPERTTIRVRGSDVPLTPGMVATADVVTRQRSILTFLLEPITQRFDEAFQVR